MPDGIFKWSDGLASSGSGTDEHAIHDNESGEINAVTEKTTPHDNDVVLIEDSEATYAKKKVKLSNLPGGGSGTDENAIHDNVSGEIAAITEKTTPADNDLLIIEDSAASNAKKSLKISNLPSGTDANAIHNNVAGEIAAITYKGAPHLYDYFLLEDSNASNAKKKIDWDGIQNNLGVQDGWIPYIFGGTVEYVSATQIRIASGSDRRNLFPVGTKVKFLQASVKYATVTDRTYSSPYTYLTLSGDAVANSTIFTLHYSHALVADGMPNETGGVWKNWTPTGITYGDMTFAISTIEVAKYCVIGKFCALNVYCYGTTGGTAGIGLGITLPLPAANYPTAPYFGGGVVRDTHIYGGYSRILPGDNALLTYWYDRRNWGIGANRGMGAQIVYEIE